MCSNMMVRFGLFYIDVRSLLISMDIRLFIMNNSLMTFVVNKSAWYPRNVVGDAMKVTTF